MITAVSFWSQIKFNKFLWLC